MEKVTYSQIWNRLKSGEAVPVGDFFRPIASATNDVFEPITKGLYNLTKDSSQEAAETAGNIGRNLNTNLVQPILEHPAFQGFVNKGTQVGETVGNKVINTYNSLTGDNLGNIASPNYTPQGFQLAQMPEDPTKPEIMLEDEMDSGNGGDTGGDTTRRVSNTTQYLTGTPAPVFTNSTDFRDYMSEATATLKEMYGDAPNYDEIEANYLDSLQAAYEGIVGEGGTLDQARAIADQQFGLAREQTERGFREGRQQLAEQSFLGERQMQQQLASRGLGGSGLAQLGKVQQKIAEGGAASNLYRDFANSVQQLSLQEAQTQLGFAQAEADLNLALTRDLQDIQNRFRQERQAYNQWKGNTLAGLAEAIKNGNLQSYQIQMDEWNRGLSMAQMMDQEAKDSAALELDVINDSYEILISRVENRTDLSDEEKAAEIDRLRSERIIKMDQVGAAIGMGTGNTASGILGSQTAIPRRETFFSDEEGNFKGVIPSIYQGVFGDGMEQNTQNFGSSIIGGLFGDRAQESSPEFIERGVGNAALELGMTSLPPNLKNWFKTVRGGANIVRDISDFFTNNN